MSFFRDSLLACSHQLLLRKRPEEFRRAVDDATEVEYALNFDGTCRDRSQREVNTMRDQQPQPADSSHPGRPDEKLSQLQHALDEMTKRMESLELMLKTKQGAETRPPGTEVDVQQPLVFKGLTIGFVAGGHAIDAVRRDTSSATARSDGGQLARTLLNCQPPSLQQVNCILRVEGLMGGGCGQVPTGLWCYGFGGAL